MPPEPDIDRADSALSPEDQQGQSGPVRQKSGKRKRANSALSDKSSGIDPDADIHHSDHDIAHASASAREEQAPASNEVLPPLGPSDPETDPVKRALQHRAFELSVTKRWPDTKIGRELGIERHTVALYIRMEWERRRGSIEQDLQLERERSITFYEQIRNRAEARMFEPGARGDEMRYALQAQENIDKLKGLHAPVKLDHGDGAGVINVTPQQAALALIQIGERKTAREAAADNSPKSAN